jgi:hypothetical protein
MQDNRSSVNNGAHISGSAAFLLPEGVTSPRSGIPPSIVNESSIAIPQHLLILRFIIVYTGLDSNQQFEIWGGY